MGYASEQNKTLSKFRKFTKNSLDSIPKQKLLNKACLHERPPHRNNNKQRAEKSQ